MCPTVPCWCGAGELEEIVGQFCCQFITLDECGKPQLSLGTVPEHSCVSHCALPVYRRRPRGDCGGRGSGKCWGHPCEHRRGPCSEGTAPRCGVEGVTPLAPTQPHVSAVFPILDCTVRYRTVPYGTVLYSEDTAPCLGVEGVTALAPTQPYVNVVHCTASYHTVQCRRMDVLHVRSCEGHTFISSTLHCDVGCCSYDLTPADCITAVITELGMVRAHFLPCLFSLKTKADVWSLESLFVHTVTSPSSTIYI